MSLVIDGSEFYRIGEALSIAGVSRATYFRWISQGKVPDTRFRDRNGRRLFTPGEMHALETIAKRLVAVPYQASIPLEDEGSR